MPEVVVEQSVCVPSETGRQHAPPTTLHIANTVKVQAAAAHVPAALHDCPPVQDPQERPQTGSGPHVRLPHERVHVDPLVMHDPKPLQVVAPEHVPQLAP